MFLSVENLTHESFGKFGKVIEQPSRAPDASGPGWQWWAGVSLLAGGDRPYAIGALDLQPAEHKFDWAERHMRTDELLIPVSGDCLVYVGPPEHRDDPGRLPALESFKVFRVRQGQAVLLEKGVWHGAPLADGRPAKVLVLLLNETGSLDNSVVRFPERAVGITV
jgi:ureidoglycolate lyase